VIWWLLGFLARALEPSERHAVLGDIAESGAGIFPALRDLLDLIIRRQAALWAHWQPWLALMGIGVIAGASLNRIAGRFSLDLFEQWSTYRRYGVHYATGLTPREDFGFLACLAAGLILWSWTCGFALGSLSRRSAWITWFVFAAILDAHLFLIPTLCGAVPGARGRVLSLRNAFIVGAMVIVLAILAIWMSGLYDMAQLTWSGGVWHGGSQPVTLPFLLVTWPAAWLLINAVRQQTDEGTTK
jgi:hypothetical protein